MLKTPVLDETGLTEKYDFELELPTKGPDSVLEAVREQLGLELIPTTRLIKILVIKKRDDNLEIPLSSTTAPEGYAVEIEEKTQP